MFMLPVHGEEDTNSKVTQEGTNTTTLGMMKRTGQTWLTKLVGTNRRHTRPDQTMTMQPTSILFFCV
uniref:Uncharacterized protein n=1 Tax=Ciona savignyi TaxID=51511 RepID=H2YF03_CIOSA